MVAFNENTARKKLTIVGHIYDIAQPFEEGHVCTANEANVLNQILAENCRNNFAPRLKKEDAVVPTQEEFDAYVAGYEFGVRSVSSSDPVLKEMKAIAESYLINALRQRGKTKASMSKEDFDNAVAAAIEKNYDALFAKATQIIELRAANLDI